MSTKRKRGEEPLVKIDAVIDRILKRISEWVDPCGCAYTTEHEVSRERDAATLQVGFFDSLTCKQIQDVLDMALPGDYTIRDTTVKLTKKTIVFRIQRLRRDASAPDAPAQAAGVPTPEQSSMDVMKLRISFGVAHEDAAAVQTSISALVKLIPQSTFKVTSKPATYSVVFSCKDALVQGAVSFAAQLDGMVDFDHHLLVVDVRKTKPDILD